MSDMFDLSPQDGLSQGDLIFGLSAHGYESSRTLGIVVTARCDFAQEKADVINYVPVVPIRDWFDREGWRRPAAEELSNVTNQVISGTRRCLRKTDVGESEIETSVHVYGGEATLGLITDSGGQADEKLRLQCERLDELRRSAETATRPGTMERKLVQSLLQNLQTHRLTDLYCLPLPFLGDNENDHAHVALLRQIYSVRSTCLTATTGVQCIRLAPDGGPLPPLSDDSEIPFGRVARMRSPYTEHFLQRTTMLFARVGVTDVRFQDIQMLAESIQ